MDAHLLRQLLALVCKHLCAVLSAVLSRSVVPESLQPHGLYSARLLCPWDFPRHNTGVGCHAHLQGNLPNPRIKPGTPTLQVDSLPRDTREAHLNVNLIQKHLTETS